MNLDPIVALAGAAANNGMRMFAKELLDTDGAAVYVALYQLDDASLKGADDLTVARVIDDRIKRAAQ